MDGSASAAEVACLREVRALERSVNWLVLGEVGGWGWCCGGLRGFLVGFFLRSGESLGVLDCVPLNMSSSETCATLFGFVSSPEPSSSPPPKGAGLRSFGAGLAAPAFLRPNENPGLLIVLARPAYKGDGR